jgi:hypothetical protein
MWDPHLAWKDWKKAELGARPRWIVQLAERTERALEVAVNQNSAAAVGEPEKIPAAECVRKAA